MEGDAACSDVNDGGNAKKLGGSRIDDSMRSSWIQRPVERSCFFCSPRDQSLAGGIYKISTPIRLNVMIKQ